MSPEPVVYDISSDEEDAVSDGSVNCSVGSKSALEWLSELLELDDEPWTSKDVVIVDRSPGLQNLGSISSFTAKSGSDDDADDDCMVLDGDPNKSREDYKNEGNGSDELLIVGEKGQVACRDFPHSRHLCAIFPFGTTSHEKFCKLCHCYVCDVPAPCAFWDKDSSNVDHCHSSDKEEKWKLLRESFRRANNTAANTANNVAVLSSVRRKGMRLPSMRMSGIRTLHDIPSGTISSASIYVGTQLDSQSLFSVPSSSPARTLVPLQNSSSRTRILHPCSKTRFRTPSIISQRCNQNLPVIHDVHRFGNHDGARTYSGIGGSQNGRPGLSPHLLCAHARGEIVGALTFGNATPKRPRTSIAHQRPVYSREVQRSSGLPAASLDNRLGEWQDVLLGRDSNPETDSQRHGLYPQPEVESQSFTQTGVESGTDLFNSAAPAISFLDPPVGGWLDAGSTNVASNVSWLDFHDVPESNEGAPSSRSF